MSYLGNNSEIFIYTPTSASTQLSVKGGGTVSLNYVDACGIPHTDGVTVYSTCYSFSVSASPNPTKNNIKVSLIPEDDNQVTDANHTAPLQSIESKDQTIISLFEMTTGILVKQWKYNKSNTNSYDLNISGLRKGVYVLQVDKENQTRVTKVIIQ